MTPHEKTVSLINTLDIILMGTEGKSYPKDSLQAELMEHIGVDSRAIRSAITYYTGKGILEEKKVGKAVFYEIDRHRLDKVKHNFGLDT